MSATATESAPVTTTRDDVIELIRRMPADVTLEDIQYALYVRQKCDASFAQLDAGQGIPHEEAMQRLSKWLS